MGRVRLSRHTTPSNNFQLGGISVDERNLKNDESYFEVKREERRVRTVMIFLAGGKCQAKSPDDWHQ